MSTSRSVDFSELFRLGDPLANRPLRLAPTEEWLDTRKAFLLSRGEWQPPKPVMLRTKMGGQAADFLWSTFGYYECVSGRVVELLREHGFTGWTAYPVDVFGRKGEVLAEYFGLGITGRGGKRDRSRSQIVTKPPPVPGGKAYDVYKGFFFDASQWDGSDIFLVDGFKIVTRRVSDTFRRAKVTNIRLTPLIDVEIDVSLDKFGRPSE